MMVNEVDLMSMASGRWMLYTPATLVLGARVASGFPVRTGAPPESLSHERQSEATFDFAVHQAAGVVAVQAAMSISSALIALRMRAFTTSETLSSVAAQVISRVLRFDMVQQDWIEGGP